MEVDPHRPTASKCQRWEDHKDFHRQTGGFEMELTPVGMDIAKHVFQVHAVKRGWARVLRVFSRAPAAGSRAPSPLRCAVASNRASRRSAIQTAAHLHRVKRAHPSARLREKMGRIRRKPQAMFVKLRTARFLKSQSDARGITVGFTGRVARLARVHHYGETDQVAPGGPAYRYPARKLLGFTPADRQIIRDRLLAYLALSSVPASEFLVRGARGRPTQLFIRYQIYYYVILFFFLDSFFYDHDLAFFTVSLYPEQVDDSRLVTLFLTLNLGEIWTFLMKKNSSSLSTQH